jgi:hypothetical protein
VTFFDLFKNRKKTYFSKVKKGRNPSKLLPLFVTVRQKSQKSSNILKNLEKVLTEKINFCTVTKEPKISNKK